jgi:TonB family protein
MASRYSLGAIATVLLCAASAFAQSAPVHTSAHETPGAQEQSDPKPAVRIRMSAKEQQSKLTHFVPPVYPPIAIATNLQGTVVLDVMIARDGSVAEATYVSGPVLLVHAAIAAVKQWRYERTLLNGQPLEVETTVSVSFVIATGRSSAGQPKLSTGSSSRVVVLVPKTVEPSIDPQLKADILRLINLTKVLDNAQKGVQQMYDSLRPTIIRSLPDTPRREQIADEFAQKLEALAASQEFRDRLVAVYAKYFDDKQIKGLIQFYESPVGQHYNAVQIQMSNDLAEVGRELAREHLPAIYKDMCTDYPELQGKAKFCPEVSNSPSVPQKQ